MNFITKQEAFDIGLTGIRSQGYVQSVTESGACVYRGPNNLKCIAGHVIPDHVYKPWMDNADYETYDCSFRALISKSREVARLFEPSQLREIVNMVARMQGAHDRTLSNPSRAGEFEEEMAEIAEEFDVIYQPPGSAHDPV